MTDLSRVDPEVRALITDGAHATEWSEFVGQDKAKRMLRLAAASAKARGARMGHVLLAAPYAGIGKTSLAFLVALERATGIKCASGKITVNEARVLLADCQDSDVLFIDEAHQMGKGAEWLLHYMQNGKLMGPRGPEDGPQVTVIAATTEPGLLPAPVLDRFEYKPVLTPYSHDEATEIALTLAMKLFPLAVPIPNEEVLHGIAGAGSCRPRIMRSLLLSLRDLASVGEISGPDYDLDVVLDLSEVTADGLTHQAQRYLTILLTEHGSGPAGLTPLGDRLGEKGAGMADLESLLLDKGLIIRQPRGRELTMSGVRRAKQLVTGTTDRVTTITERVTTTPTSETFASLLS
jgi:Holliday junction DNA helicase RuvB